MRPRTAVALAAAFALASLAAPARALPPAEKDWEIVLSMYGWLASIDAEVEVDDVETDVNVKFRDLLSDLGWAMMGGVEGRYQRALLAVDVLGLQVATDATQSPHQRPFELGNGTAGILTVGGSDVHTRTTVWIVDVEPGFRVLSRPLSDVIGGTAEPDDRRRLDLDLFLGFRYWNVTNKLNVEVDPASLTVGGVVAPLPGVLPRIRRHGVRLPGEIIRNGADKDVEDWVDWFDPIVGARVTVVVTKRWTVSLRGDVGGFNIGSNASDFTWQAMLGSEIHLTEHVSLTTGYRALGLERDGVFANTILHGPQLGALFRF
jgi:hypothetical protein